VLSLPSLPDNRQSLPLLPLQKAKVTMVSHFHGNDVGKKAREARVVMVMVYNNT